MVVGRVVVAFLMPVAFLVEAWIRSDGTWRLYALVVFGGLGVMLVRDAIGSLRRWDERHRATGAP